MRDDFTEEVKRALAARAGSVCSNPDCRASTSGPQDDSTKALNVGVAAHITSAAGGGPRYNPSLASEERRHPDNGIWLCQTCAKLIDNDALQFTEKLVRAWKEIAEHRARGLIGRTAPAVAEAYPILEVQFADLPLREKLGTAVAVESRVVEIPDPKNIPLYGPAPKTFYGVSLDATDNMRNRDYYREIAIYIRDRSLLCPVGVAITNASPTVAEEVWVTLDLDVAADLVVLDESDTACEPSTYWVPPIRPANRDQRVHARRYGDKYEVRIQIGTVQPGTTQWSHEPFYIGARRPMVVAARIQMTANNLRAPITLTAEIEIKTRRLHVSVDDIMKPRKRAQSE
jgi:hypothetical protein